MRLLKFNILWGFHLLWNFNCYKINRGWCWILNLQLGYEVLAHWHLKQIEVHTHQCAHTDISAVFVRFATIPLQQHLNIVQPYSHDWLYFSCIKSQLLQTYRNIFIEHIHTVSNGVGFETGWGWCTAVSLRWWVTLFVRRCLKSLSDLSGTYYHGETHRFFVQVNVIVCET